METRNKAHQILSTNLLSNTPIQGSVNMAALQELHDEDNDCGVFDSDRRENMRKNRPNNRKDYDSNPLLGDFLKCKYFKERSSFSNELSDENSDSRKSLNSEIKKDEELEYFRTEWKYCCGVQPHLNQSLICRRINYFRHKLQHILHSVPFHIIISILVLLDIITVLLELSIETIFVSECQNSDHCERFKCGPNGSEISLNLTCGFQGFGKQCIKEEEHGVEVDYILGLISLSILFIFIIEIFVKFFAFGFKIFLKFFEVFDAIIVIASFIIDLVHFAIGKDDEKLVIFELVIALRLWRVVRIITTVIANYNALKEEKHEKNIKNVLLEEEKHYKLTLEEYKLAKIEILRLREYFVERKESPFPEEYNISRVEASALGFAV